jgi:hypothetical protein
VQGDDGGPFVVVGLDQSQEIKIFRYKEHCKICGDIFMLCPARKNLAANLQIHLVALKHVKAQEDAMGNGKSMSSALSTGHRGRPAVATRAVIGNQLSMHKWFHLTQSSS